MFLEVLGAIYDIDQGKSDCEHRHTHHHALGYMVEDGKLWWVADGKMVHAKVRQECVSQEEAGELAAQEHRENGHWG